MKHGAGDTLGKKEARRLAMRWDMLGEKQEWRSAARWASRITAAGD
jgi:hypothetical protein